MQHRSACLSRTSRRTMLPSSSRQRESMAVPSPGVVVADRWGEVYYVQEADRAAALPPPAELIDWLRFVRDECPECQGETR
jgi:hypothetical protein